MASKLLNYSTLHRATDSLSWPLNAEHSTLVSCLCCLKAFDTIDKDGSGYVEEREWRRVTEDTPLAASDESSLWIERVCATISANPLACSMILEYMCIYLYI